MSRELRPTGGPASGRLPVTQEATIANYRIVCTVKQPSGHANPKEHVVAVGVGDDASTAAPWTLDAVLAAMDLAVFLHAGHNKWQRRTGPEIRV